MPAHRVLTDVFKAAKFYGEESDPGDGGSFRVSRSPSCLALVSEGIETRVVEQPDRPGLFLIMYMTVDGGDIAVTVTGGYDDIGTTVFDFTDAGQYAVFISIQSAPNEYEWRLLADG
jgi:hypothetical protein